MKYDIRLLFFVVVLICIISFVLFNLLSESRHKKSYLSSCGYINSFNIEKNVRYFNSKHSDDLLSSILIFTSVYGNMNYKSMNMIVDHLKEDNVNKKKLLDLITIFNNSLTTFLFNKELGLRDIMDCSYKDYQYIKKLFDFVLYFMGVGLSKSYNEIDDVKKNCLKEFENEYPKIYKENINLRCKGFKMSDIVFISFIKTYEILE